MKAGRGRRVAIRRKIMVARFGRSSRLGERSRGVLDAGATSCCIILTAMADGHPGAAVRERNLKRYAEICNRLRQCSCRNEGHAQSVFAEAGRGSEDGGFFSSDDPTNYPTIAEKACNLIAESGFEKRGVLVCGTGIGICMTANKCKGIRAAVGHDIFSARRSIF